MTSQTSSRRDALISSGLDWARQRGVPNHKLSAHRVGDHVHVISYMFDMSSLMAIVVQGEPGSGYSSRVKPMSICEICQPEQVPQPTDTHSRCYCERPITKFTDGVWRHDQSVSQYTCPMAAPKRRVITS